MQRAIFILLFVILPFAVLQANSPVVSFKFTTDPRTVNIGEISEEIIVQAQDVAGNPVAPGETLHLEFLSTSPTGEFLNPSGGPVSTVMNSNWKNRTFYYRDQTSGIRTLTVKAVGSESGLSWETNQKITVSGGSLPASSSPVENSGVVAQSSVAQPSSADSVDSSLLKIHAYAGSDKTAVAGSNLEFSGSATGLKDEPLENARFWWNFGNGGTKDGRTVNYSFQIPGRYMVGMHVSSGEYSASDYLDVEIVPNKLAVAGVLMGEDGYLRLQNKGPIVLDLGGWALEDGASRRFVLPARTLVNAGQEFTLSNAVSKLWLGGTLRLKLYYPNTSVALEWDGTGSLPAPVPIVLSAQKIVPEPAVSKTQETSNLVPNDTEIKDAGVPAPADIPLVEKPEAASVAGSPVSSAWLFFSGAVVLGLIAAFGFVFLKSVG